MSVITVDHDETDLVTMDGFRELTASRGMRLGADDEAAYLELLRAAEKCVRYIHARPAWEDPRLRPDVAPGTSPAESRPYTRPANGSAENPLGAWSHRTAFRSAQTTQSGGTGTGTGTGAGLLAGRTVAAKDNVLVAGVPLTLGTSAAHLSSSSSSSGGKGGGDGFPVPTIDAPVVQRVLAAGATFAGTAVCENYCMSALSFTSDTGAVANPWLLPPTPDDDDDETKNGGKGKGSRHAYACGGSSSGCGALVAAYVVRQLRARRGLPIPAGLVDGGDGGGVELALGGDQGGSIRLPAAYSGVYGLKPTHGLVPYTGIASLHPLIDHCGPMAGSVRDAALLLAATAGWDGIDPRATPGTPLREDVPMYHEILDRQIAERTAAGTWTPTQAAKGLRVGLLTEGWAVPTLSDEVRAVTQAAARRFAALGGVVEEVSVPLHALGPAIWTAATRAQMGDNFVNVSPGLLSHPLPDLNPPAPDQAWYENMNKHNPAAVNVFFAGAHLSDPKRFPPAYRNKAVMHVHELRAAYDDALAKYDVLVTPVNPTVAMQRNERWFEGGVMGPLELALGNNMNTGGLNVSGHPAMAMPVGWGRPREPGVEGKLPIAMQLIGPRFGESKIFLAAAAWEVAGSAYDEW
ncbi:amidase signature domain-containing protein [Xylariaceae sp. FL0804]|nr:amidase signature domain-containing protein [Xylariaceae sp. FL0804]